MTVTGQDRIIKVETVQLHFCCVVVLIHESDGFESLLKSNPSAVILI